MKSAANSRSVINDHYRNMFMKDHYDKLSKMQHKKLNKYSSESQKMLNKVDSIKNQRRQVTTFIAQGKFPFGLFTNLQREISLSLAKITIF